jgi:hypothetical protein
MVFQFPDLLFEKRTFFRHPHKRHENPISSSAWPPALAGYARVSRIGQTLAMQHDALKAAGCQRVFLRSGVSGTVTQRRGLDAALGYLRAGDTLIVWKVDRLGRSLSHLVRVISELDERAASISARFQIPLIQHPLEAAWCCTSSRRSSNSSAH